MTTENQAPQVAQAEPAAQQALDLRQLAEQAGIKLDRQDVRDALWLGYEAARAAAPKAGDATFPAPDLRGIDGATHSEWRTLGVPAGAILIQEKDLPTLIERACLAYAGAPAKLAGYVTAIDEGKVLMLPRSSLDTAGLVPLYTHPGDGWKPIETAPKDGTKVLVWFSELFGGMVDVAMWSDDKFAKKPRPYWSGRGERIYGVLAYREGKPTRWQPLPVAPIPSPAAGPV